MQYVSAHLDNVAVSTTATETLIQLLSGTNRPLEIVEVGIFCDGATSTATPIDVSLAYQSDAGTSSALAAGDLTPWDERHSESVVTTGFKTITVEPTTGEVPWSCHVHPQSGLCYRLPVPIYVTTRIGLRARAAAAVNVNCYILFGE